MPGKLAPLQQVADTPTRQNFDQIYQAWDPGVYVATALPTGTADGQFTYLQTAAMAALTPPVMWLLRYAAGVGWFPLGATPLVSEADPYTTIAAPDRGTTLTAYADLPTGAVGPAVALPAPGWYVVEQGFGAYHGTAGGLAAMSYAIGATAAVDLDATAIQVAAASTDIPRAMRVQPPKLFAAAVTLTSKYRTGAGTATFRGPRFMRVTPVLL